MVRVCKCPLAAVTWVTLAHLWDLKYVGSFLRGGLCLGCKICRGAPLKHVTMDCVAFATTQMYGLTILEARILKSKCQQGWPPPGDSEGESVLGFSCSFWWLPGILAALG